MRIPRAACEPPCYKDAATPMRKLLLACLAGVVLAATGPAVAVGQDPDPGLGSAAMNSDTPTTPGSSGSARSFGSRFGWLWFPGAVVFYFALQLWILPKMGVPT